jgi:hypothetical protein
MQMTTNTITLTFEADYPCFESPEPDKAFAVLVLAHSDFHLSLQCASFDNQLTRQDEIDLNTRLAFAALF